MSIETKMLAACLGKSERAPPVKKVLAALGIERVPPPKKERWKGFGSPVTVLNGWAQVRVPRQGVTLEFDFPEDREGFTERPLSHKGPRSVTRVVLHAAGRVDGKRFDAYRAPLLLGWTLTEPLEALRSKAKAERKAYARGPGKTPDSIRLGKVCFVIYRKKANGFAERVVLER